MSDAPSYLAIDLGASSGRAVVGTLDGAGMRTREVHRFRTPLVEAAGHLYWDVHELWVEIRRGIASALEAAPALRSISVDSWAVDYVPLGGSGTQLRRPYAYRDPRTKGRLPEVVRRVGGAAALYGRTGIQFLDFNTLPQVAADLTDEPALVERTATRLLMADYFLYLLSGARIAERTMASTTQALDAATGQWAEDVIRAVGDAPSRWPPIVDPGTVLGPMRREAAPLGTSHAPLVLATCSHDTAAAVAAVPADGTAPWAFVSSGTWSLVGAELDAPILHDGAREAGFTNEAGLDGTIRFLKNRTGMWVLEECLREWNVGGGRTSHATLVAEAEHAPPAGYTVDLDAPGFAERGRMVAKLEAAARERGMAPPATRGGLVRLVFESLAAGYARTLDELDALTSRRTAVVHVVGGGARNDLLNQLTADACGRRVLAGPDEATVLGNLLVQARALGDLPSGVTVRDVARRSARITEYAPRGAAPDRAPALAAP